MKTLSITSDLDEINKIFANVQSSVEVVVAWQVDPLTQTRNIFHSTLSKIINQDNSLLFTTINDAAYDFNSEPVYFYVENKMFIFKSEQISIQNNLLSVNFPDELKLLDEAEDDKLKAVFSSINPDYEKVAPSYVEALEPPQKGYEFVSGSGPDANVAPDWQRAEGGGRTERIETMWKGAISQHNNQSDRDKNLFEQELSFVTLDEEDKKYADQRIAPRAKPPEGKMVIIQSKTHSFKQEEVCPLYDLSRGGLGFMVFSESAYEKGEVVNVLGFDESKFDQPMFVIVRSIREADELGIQFKVGCQFIDALAADEQSSTQE